MQQRTLVDVEIHTNPSRGIAYECKVVLGNIEHVLLAAYPILKPRTRKQLDKVVIKFNVALMKATASITKELVALKKVRGVKTLGRYAQMRPMLAGQLTFFSPGLVANAMKEIVVFDSFLELTHFAFVAGLTPKPEKKEISEKFLQSVRTAVMTLKKETAEILASAGIEIGRRKRVRNMPAA